MNTAALAIGMVVFGFGAATGTSPAARPDKVAATSIMLFSGGAPSMILDIRSEAGRCPMAAHEDAKRTGGAAPRPVFAIY
jgi:hypothetical protein